MFITKSSVNPLLTVGRSEKDLEYLKFQFNIFKNLCSTKGIFAANKFDKNTNKLYMGYKFRTRSLSVLKPIHNIWYSNKAKIIPTNLQLTPTTIAHWVCDDGCIRFKKDNSGKQLKSLILKISTNSFSRNETEFLAKSLSDRYNVKFSIYKDSMNWYKKKNLSYVEKDNNYYIMTYTDGAIALYKDIESVFPIGMERKSKIWKEVLNK